MIAVVCKSKPRNVAPGVRAAARHGTDVGGLLRYLYGDGKLEEHRDPHIVGSWDGDNAGHEPDVYTTSSGGTRASVNKLAGILTDPILGVRGMNITDPHVYHLALSNKAGSDQPLSDAQWGEIAADMMDRVGIAPRGDPGGCRWVAVRHGLSAQGNDHVHVVAVLARQDGGKPRIWGDYQALREGAQEWERRLGLTLTADADGTARKTAGRGEQAKEVRAGRIVPLRDELSATVAAAAAGAREPGEFFDRLRARGLDVAVRTSPTRPETVIGYSVGKLGHLDRHGMPVRVAGGKLDGQSLPKLQAMWKATGQPGPITDRAAAFGDLPRPVIVGSTILSSSTDAGTQAGIANAMADSAAAMAAAQELTGSGPWHDIATEFGRAGRPVRGASATESYSSGGLRAAGQVLFVMKGAVRGKEQRQVMELMAALMLMADSMARWRDGQGKHGQAAAARRAVELARAYRGLGLGGAIPGPVVAPRAPVEGTTPPSAQASRAAQQAAAAAAAQAALARTAKQKGRGGISAS